MALITPQIYTAGGMDIAASPVFLAVPTALLSAALAYHSFLVTGAGGVEAAVSGDNVIAYILENFMDANIRAQNQTYATAVDLAASAHYVTAYPFAGLTLLMGEDGAGGNIADWVATPYADIVVGTISTISANAYPLGTALANVQIDSSSASASATNLPLKIIAPDPSASGAIVPAANPKNYLVIQNTD